MSITRGEFLRSLGKSLPGMVASSGMAAAAGALVRRIAQAAPEESPNGASPSGVTAPEMTAMTRVPFWAKGPGKDNQITLTFDDGPVPGVTDRILDALKERQLTATFFMIGRLVADAPELARRVRAEGHEIGNHTYTHPKLTELADAEVEQEISKTEAIFDEVLGHRAAWFRPPFGALRQDQAKFVSRRGMQVAMWSIDTQDWKEDPTLPLGDPIFDQVEPGSIILCHDRAQTADLLPGVLDELMKRRLQLVSLSTLLALNLPLGPL